MENNNQKPKLEEAGAFWMKKSKTGTSFLTGTVKSKSGEEIKVIVFKNKYKTEGSNQPDYRVYFDSQPAGSPEANNPAQKTTKVTKDKTEAQAESAPKEEIPF